MNKPHPATGRAIKAKIATALQPESQGQAASPLAGDEGLNEILSALKYLDAQLWPAQTGWSDKMQIAIENLHFHNSQIQESVSAFCRLKAIESAAREVCDAYGCECLASEFQPHCPMCLCRAALDG